MAMRIARPMRRRNTRNEQFKKRLPKDIAKRMWGKVLMFQIGDSQRQYRIKHGAEVLQFSLRTSEPMEIKRRHSACLAAFERQCEAIRHGPQPLTKKQIVGLAGEVFHSWNGIFEDDPLDPSTWTRMIKGGAKALSGGGVPPLIGESEQERLHRALESRFGTTVDWVLAQHELVVTENCRQSLLVETAHALTEAALKLDRNASGDYSESFEGKRFPKYEPAKRSRTLAEAKDGWWAEQSNAGGSPRSLEAANTACKLLHDFLGHERLSDLTKQDIIRFKDHRVLQGIKPKTINGSNLAMLNAILNWAVHNDWIAENPAHGIAATTKRNVVVRPKAYSDDEAQSLLSAAYSEFYPTDPSKPVSAAKFWVPWLAAFTGARVGELVQLRAEDVYRTSDRWVIKITPDAGSVKGRKYRVVPLHKQIIELGFPDYVSQRTGPYLFLKNSHKTFSSGAAKGVANKIRDFVRTVIANKDLQPNHAWRHRLLMMGRRLEISDRTMFDISGHAGATPGNSYGDPDLVAMINAIDKFPSFDISA